MHSIGKHQQANGRLVAGDLRSASGRLLFWLAALAFAQGAWAAPTVSGDGACGARAVDNESFVTCDGDRVPPPAGAPEGTPAGETARIIAVMLSCRLVADPPRQADEAAPAGTVFLQCRSEDVDRLVSARR